MGKIWEIYGQHMVKEMLGVPLYRSLAGLFIEHPIEMDDMDENSGYLHFRKLP